MRNLWWTRTAPRNQKLKITIPAGVDNGTRLRVTGEGDSGMRNGPPGDLYVYLFVAEDAAFHRDGINLLSELKISYIQAILGSRVEVNTLDDNQDKLQELVIPAGIQPGTVLKLEGKGVPRLGNSVSRGDHLIAVSIDIPTKIAPEERELLEKLAKIRGDRTEKGALKALSARCLGHEQPQSGDSTRCADGFERNSLPNQFCAYQTALRAIGSGCSARSLA